MYIVSNHKAHQLAVLSEGKTTINGIVFVPGANGKPTAFQRTDRDCELFLGVEGYSFYHDDNTFSGDSLKAPVVVSATGEQDPEVAKAADQQKAERIILEQLRTGTLSPEVLAALEKVVPRIQSAEPTTAGGILLPTSTDAPKADAPATDAPGAGDSGPGLDQVDVTNAEQLAALKRPALLGIATSLGLGSGVGVSNADFAAQIAEAAKAKKAAETPAQ